LQLTKGSVAINNKTGQPFFIVNDQGKRSIVELNRSSDPHTSRVEQVSRLVLICW
jgi:hypothetical protein